MIQEAITAGKLLPVEKPAAHALFDNYRRAAKANDDGLFEFTAGKELKRGDALEALSAYFASLPKKLNFDELAAESGGVSADASAVPPDVAAYAKREGYPIFNGVRREGDTPSNELHEQCVALMSQDSKLKYWQAYQRLTNTTAIGLGIDANSPAILGGAQEVG